MTQSPWSFHIRDMLRVDVWGRQFSDLHDYYDGNWLEVTISARDDQSQVSVSGPNLTLIELADLHLQCLELLAGKRTTTTLSIWEPVLHLRISKIDELGHFELIVSVITESYENPDGASRHRYYRHIGQSDVQILVKELDAVLLEFPVRGRREPSFYARVNWFLQGSVRRALHKAKLTMSRIAAGETQESKARRLRIREAFAAMDHWIEALPDSQRDQVIQQAVAKAMTAAERACATSQLMDLMIGLRRAQRGQAESEQ